MANPPGKLILVVDDDPAHGYVCERVLSQAGYRVLSARDGAEALQVLAHSPVDGLLVDIFMPGVDGFEVIQEVRQRCPNVAVVAMTGGSDGSSVDEILTESTRLGARAVLAKPFTAERLTNIVASVLGPP